MSHVLSKCIFGVSEQNLSMHAFIGKMKLKETTMSEPRL